MGLDIYLHKFTTKENKNAQECRIYNEDFIQKLKKLGIKIYKKNQQFHDIKNPKFKYSPDKGWDCGVIAEEDGIKTYHFRREKDGKIERAEAVVGVDEIPIKTEEVIYFCYEEPEIYYQRKGMNDEFYKKYPPLHIITNEKEVKEMIKFSIDPEYTQGFLDKFEEGKTFILFDY